VIESEASKAECQVSEQLLLQLKAKAALTENETNTENEAKFRAVAESATSAIFIYQKEQLCYVNPATEKVTGYSQAELYTMNFWDLVDPKCLCGTGNLEKQLGKPVFIRHELELVTKHGEERCLEVIATWAEFKGHPALFGTACDVT
jgi:PAS domain S-box-containing protein